MMWLTVLYGHNRLVHMRKLWDDIGDTAASISGPWALVGHMNNVLSVNDRIGGDQVKLHEYQDLEDITTRVGLCEICTVGDHVTWSNKHRNDMIYSRIDHALRNVDWFLQFSNCSVEILEPTIFDHCPLRIIVHCPSPWKGNPFKFLNFIVETCEFLQVVQRKWSSKPDGRPMFVLWMKLHLLQPHMRKINHKFFNLPSNIEVARSRFVDIQQRLIQDKLNIELLEE